MACGCAKKAEQRFLWIPEGESSESPSVVAYESEIQAKAKVMRKGGSYIPLIKAPTGQYVVGRA